MPEKSYSPPDLESTVESENVSSADGGLPIQNLIGNTAIAGMLGKSDTSCDYEVKPGDTLWGISKRFLGGGAQWEDLYKHNQGVVGDNPNLILPGQPLDVCTPGTSPGDQNSSQSSPVIDLTKNPQSVAITAPTTIRSSLGDMTVVPDDYTGKIPEGAVRQSDHEKMVQIYDRISGGQSQISVDASKYLNGIDPMKEPEKYKAALEKKTAFEDQYKGYMKDLVKTPTGLKLLGELDGSKYKTRIAPGTTNETINDNLADSLLRSDGSKNKGTGSTITMDPSLKSYAKAGQKEEPWMTERERYGFYHELVHAYHDSQGETATGSHNGQSNWEWQVMGMGPWASEDVSDNKIRGDFGKAQRPNYGGKTY